MSSEAFCKNLEYDKDNDMLIWTLYFTKSDSIKNIASPAKSFAEAVGITKNISKDDWEKFCESMKNKKINFILPEDKQ